MRVLSVILAVLVLALWPAPGGTIDGASPRRQPVAAAARPAGSFAPAPDPGPLPAFGHGAMTPFRPASSPRELVLSFDDGPDLRTTPSVLEELDRRGLKAVFFISGWRLLGEAPEYMARRDLVRKLAAHGHLIGNHTIHHRDLCRNQRAQEEEIDANSELIAQAAGLRPLLFRSPYGADCESLRAALAARDLVDVGWNLDPQDWNGASDDQAIYDYAIAKLGQMEGRGILLLHDTRSDAVRALPRILDWIDRENARAAIEGRPPIKLLDYSVFLPEHPVPATGLEPILTDLGALLELLPGAEQTKQRLRYLAATGS